MPRLLACVVSSSSASAISGIPVAVQVARRRVDGAAQPGGQHVPLPARVLVPGQLFDPRGQTDDVRPPVAIQIRHHRLVAAGQLTVDDVGDDARSGPALLGGSRPCPGRARRQRRDRQGQEPVAQGRVVSRPPSTVPRGKKRRPPSRVVVVVDEVEAAVAELQQRQGRPALRRAGSRGRSGAERPARRWR